jgi:hypothetical protein
MKNHQLFLLKFLTLIALIVSTQRSQAQTLINLSEPDTVGACMDNIYTIIVETGSFADTVRIRGLLTAVGSPLCSTQGIDFRADSNNVPNLASILIEGDSLVFLMPANSVDTIYYHAYIDCHVIPDSSIASNIDFVQNFSSIYGVVVNGSGSSFSSNNIQYPFIIELNPNLNFTGYYLTDTAFTFIYRNTGSINANMRFFFDFDTSEYCHQISTDTIKYQKGVTGSLLGYSPGSSIVLQPGDSLLIRQIVRLDTCISSSCPNNTATFRWECDYPEVVSDNFCSSCRDDYHHSYDVNKDNDPKIDVLRITPTDAIYDFSCMNDSLGTLWSYKIINTSDEAIDTLKFNLIQNTNQLNNNNIGNLKFLSLVPKSSLTITKTGNVANLDTVTVQRVAYLCTDIVPDALHKMEVRVKNFLKTDTISISFRTVRCSSSDTVLFNVNKNYNQWGFDSLQVVSVCGVERMVNSTSGLMPNTTYISGQAVGQNYDVDLKVTFMPTITDLNYTTALGGESAEFFMDFKTLLSNKLYVYQLLGCNDINVNCDTLAGWLRAKVITKTNLIVESPSSEAYLRKINSTSNDTVIKYANWWHSTIDTSICMDREYYYYFNLADSAMRNYLDSGQFVFNLTACCSSDVSPTPCFVEYHLLAKPDPGCFNAIIPSSHDSALVITNPKQKWLSLSVEDNDIAVHCPGCLAPGIIVDYYQMNRKSLGLQDTDDDGRADSANAVIDIGSSWYNTHKNKLKLNFSTFNDRVEDFLVAHLQEGDDSNGGYTYVQMQAPPLNLRFNALQLSRRIPHGMQTMNLIPDTLLFYIDSPTNSTGGCYECDDYGMGANDFTTQLKLTVTGSDIFTHFLDTIINNNEFLFKFVDTLGGNLQNSAFVDSVFTTNTFTGFYEGQYYRMKVIYRACGNFMGVGTDIDTYVKESKILNLMWVSGKVQTTSAIPQMLNDLDTLHGSGLTVYLSDSAYALIDTAYINNHLFFCETRGSMHYFVSSDAFNESSVTNNPGCEKTMTAIATTKIAGGKNIFDVYPYEYRPPLVGADSIFVQIPTGYYLHSAGLKNRLIWNTFEYNSDTIDLPLTNTTGTVAFALDDYPGLNCFTQVDTPSVLNQTFWSGDQLNRRIIEMKIRPIDCNPASIIPPDTSLLIAFGQQTINCLINAGCDLPGPIKLKQENLNPKLIISPNLSMSTTASTANAISDTVCWNITLTNSTVDSITAADNVFIAVNPGAISSLLAGWHFYPGASTTFNYLNDTIVPIIASLVKGASITGNLCARVIGCDTINTVPINIHYGWNCINYPESPYDSTEICEYENFQLNLTSAPYKLNSALGKVFESPYTLCDTIPVTTCFQSINDGNLYPYEILLTNINPGVQILGGSMSNLSASVLLTPSGNDSIWTIDPDSINLLYPGGGFNFDSPQMCFTFNILLDCAYAGDSILPDKILFARSFCGDTVSFNAEFSQDPEFVWNDSTICNDCFTLDKFVVDSLAYTGIPFTYYVAACNFNADSNIVTIGDQLPPGFIATTSLPITTTLHYMECDTFAITGIFGAADSCPHSTNIAMLIHNSDTLLTDSVCVPVISTTDLCIAEADTVWTGVLYSTTLPTLFSNQTIFITDSLVVNDSLKFFNCDVIMGGGSSITIVTGGVMHVTSTNIVGCDTMWRGISVNGQQLYVVENSLIRDANIAVLAKDKSIISIIDTRLFNNAKNVVIPTTLGVTNMSVSLTMHGDSIAMVSGTFMPKYPGQPNHAFRPLSGVEAHHWVGTIGDPVKNKNVFHNLISGISAERSLINVQHNDFRNMFADTTGLFNITLHGIGVSIFSTVSQTPSSVIISRDNYFYNCINSSYTNRCATNIQEVTMDSVRTGIHIRNGGNTYSEVRNCTINAYSYGVDLLFNGGATGMDITENTITINKNASGTAGISMEENSTNKAYYFISNNNITIAGARDGIVANSVFYPVIVNNVIDQLVPSSSPNANRGINISASDSAIVSCNIINSTYTTSSAHATGIRVNISRDCDVACNSVYDQYYGIHWGGSCINSSLFGNAINKHYVGLYLNNSANIGLQPFKGNTWLDTTQYLSGYGAVNLNYSPLPNLGFSLITTNSTIAAHNPKRPLSPGSNPFAGVNNSTWFNPQPSGNTIACSDSGLCESFQLHEGDDEMRLLIAKDSSLTSSFIPESKMMAKQQLYDELIKNPSLASSDTVYQNFVSNQETTSIGYLREALIAFKNSTIVDESLYSSIKTADSLCKLLSLEIFQLDTLIAGNPLINYNDQREDLVDNFNIHQQVLQDLHTQQKSIDSTFVSNAEIKNNLVSPTELPDENEKFINSVQVVFMNEGITAITTWYNQILAIAQQCPFEGGTSVYRARTLIREMGYVVDYDDDNSCLQAGYYRNSAEPITETNSLDFSIVPNPANEYTEIILSENREGNCTLNISDMKGKTVYQLNINSRDKIIRLPTSSLSPSMYQVSISCNNQNSVIKKLSIVR